MTLTAIVDVITSLGLPIALIAILLFVVWTMGKRMNQQSDKNMEQVQARCKEREEKLYEEIKENRKVNEKAIDTIGRYAQKLDNIQSDVKEIKQDIALIMMGGGTHHDN